MSVTCCGSNRTTPFCPRCGKQLRRDDAISELLEHLRGRERAALTVHRNSTGKASLDHLDERRRRRYRDDAASATRTAEKYKTWGDALAKLIVEKGTEL